MSALTTCPAVAPKVSPANVMATVAPCSLITAKGIVAQEGEVPDEIENHDPENAEPEAERKRHLGIRGFVRDVGDVGPSIIGEKDHGDADADET